MKTPLSKVDKIEVLYRSEQIQKAVQEAAQKIAEHYLPVLIEKAQKKEDFKLVFVAVLSGANRYRTALADEVGRIFGEAGYFGYIEEDEVSVSSYPDGIDSKEIKFLLDTKRPIAGSSVILVEDIIDQGNTASWVKEMLLAKEPSSLELYVLIDKTPRRKKDIKPDHVSFRLEKDLFVVGFGLDVGGRFRELPFIGYIS